MCSVLFELSVCLDDHLDLTMTLHETTQEHLSILHKEHVHSADSSYSSSPFQPTDRIWYSVSAYYVYLVQCICILRVFGTVYLHTTCIWYSVYAYYVYLVQCICILRVFGTVYLHTTCNCFGNTYMFARGDVHNHVTNCSFRKY